MSRSSRGALMVARRCSAWFASTRTASAHQVAPPLARPGRRGAQQRFARDASIFHARADMYFHVSLYKTLAVLSSVQQPASEHTSCCCLFSTANQLPFLLLADPSAPGTPAAAQRTPPKSDRSRPRQVSAASVEMGVMLRPAHRRHPRPSTNCAAAPPARQASYRPFLQSGKLCAIPAASAQAVEGTPQLLNRSRACSSRPSTPLRSCPT